MLALIGALAAGAARAEPPRGVVQLPAGAIAYVPVHPARMLVVLLHGAGQLPDRMIERFIADAERSRAVLLAPKSAGATWDVIAQAELSSFAPNTLSSETYRYTTSADGRRVATAQADLAVRLQDIPGKRILFGFSDGATFALALGTDRSQLFDAVVAVAPGLAVIAARPAPRRRVVVMHGRSDRTLPFAFTGSTIVPALRRAGLRVGFAPFDGGHEIPTDAWAQIDGAD